MCQVLFQALGDWCDQGRGRPLPPRLPGSPHWTEEEARALSDGRPVGGSRAALVSSLPSPSTASGARRRRGRTEGPACGGNGFGRDLSWAPHHLAALFPVGFLVLAQPGARGCGHAVLAGAGCEVVAGSCPRPEMVWDVNRAAGYLVTVVHSGQVGVAKVTMGPGPCRAEALTLPPALNTHTCSCFRLAFRDRGRLRVPGF